MPSCDLFSYVGANVYCWDQEAQNRLLIDCLQPCAEELRRETGFTRFWFDRFDARGPHVVALLTVPLGADLLAADRLEGQLNAFLSTHSRPSTTSLEEVEKRHLSCRGMALCPIDGEPDIAPDNSFRLFTHSSWGYPFRLTRGLPEETAWETWELLDKLSAWTISRLAAVHGGSTSRTAVRWLASFEQILREACSQPEQYWRFHASSLLFGLPKQLEENESRVREALQSAISQQNEQAFSAIWDEEEISGPCWPGLRELLRCVLTEADPPAPLPWRLPREIVHWTLKQLCLYVAAEIPLVLYAWRRNLQ
jgi:hypothetical protein